MRRDECGSVLMIFAVSLPLVVAAASLAVDYSRSVRARDQMQAAADASSLAAARELSLSNTKQSGMTAVVQTVVANYIGASAKDKDWAAGLRTETKLDEDNLIVRVSLTSKVPVVLGMLAGQKEWEIEATSEAQVLGQPNICMLGLDPSEKGTIALEKNADVLGEGCAVFSNSDHPNGIKSMNTSVLSASLICSAGGMEGGKANFQPEPLTGCPHFQDPLADRPEPLFDDACTEEKLVVSGESRTLTPGNYCGGLKITEGSFVNLEPGLYVINDGPLDVGGGSTMSGNGVGFYLTGKGAKLKIDADSKVSLEAALDGPMAGLLIFESRTEPAKDKHELFSDDAQIMVGTIYLPLGELKIGGSSQVGTASAYTAIVARKLTLTDGPRVVLHTDYDRTSVPVPDGIKGTKTPIALVK